MTQLADIASIPRTELRDELWRAGELDFLLDPHQQDTHDLFKAWNVRRQTSEHEALCIECEATLEDVWVEEVGRRFGKTTKWLAVLFSICFKRPGAVTMYATAFQDDISDIIVPLGDILLDTCPADMRPEYRSGKRGGKQGFYFPNGSVIKLVGLDMHPNAARGRFADAIVLSEAGFMKHLENLLRAVLLPQFSRRPWAFLVCESSTSEDPLHDFTQIVIPDAKKRDAYVMRTLDDNHMLSERAKAKAIRMAGGRGHPVCEREYYCEQTRDPETLVVPEWSQEHVQERKRPQWALSMTACDPGFEDLIGLVWGYYDFLGDRIVIEASWARRNAATRQVACVNAAYEYELWGTWPALRMRDIPLASTRTQLGWRDLLAGTPVVHHADELWRLANTEEEQRPRPKLNPWPGRALQWWNGERFELNPYLRVSDTDSRLIADLEIEYGLTFAATRKDDRDAQINRVRDEHSKGRIVYLPGAGPVIDHVKGARWNAKRTDWAKHKTYGHYDCLAAEIYFVRNIDAIKLQNPIPPKYREKHVDNVAAPKWAQNASNDNGFAGVAAAMGGGRRWR